MSLVVPFREVRHRARRHGADHCLRTCLSRWQIREHHWTLEGGRSMHRIMFRGAIRQCCWAKQRLWGMPTRMPWREIRNVGGSNDGIERVPQHLPARTLWQRRRTNQPFDRLSPPMRRGEVRRVKWANIPLIGMSKSLPWGKIRI